MAVYKLTLTDEDGVVIQASTISTEIDFDPEDLYAEEGYDYYVDAENGWITTGDIPNSIERAIDNYEGE